MSKFLDLFKKYLKFNRIEKMIVKKAQIKNSRLYQALLKNLIQA